MDLVPILALIVLVSTLSTLVLAVLSYRTVRGSRQTHVPPPAEAGRKVFLVRLTLPNDAGR